MVAVCLENANVLVRATCYQSNLKSSAQAIVRSRTYHHALNAKMLAKHM